MLTTGEEFIQVLLNELKSEAENFMERVGPGFRFVSRVVSQAKEVVLDLGKFASDAARGGLEFCQRFGDRDCGALWCFQCHGEDPS